MITFAKHLLVSCSVVVIILQLNLLTLFPYEYNAQENKAMNTQTCNLTNEHFFCSESCSSQEDRYSQRLELLTKDDLTVLWDNPAQLQYAGFGGLAIGIPLTAFLIGIIIYMFFSESKRQAEEEKIGK
jgi:hypothetical protein